MRVIKVYEVIATVVAILVVLPGSRALARGILSTSMEVEIGKSVRDDVLGDYELWEDESDNAMVEALGEELVKHAEPREGIEYEFYIIESEEVNAFAAPGGFIFLTTGLLDFCERDWGMVGGVIAHEIGHVSRRHHRDRIEEELLGTLGFLVFLDLFDIDEDWVEIGGAVGLLLIQQGHSREDEYDADEQAVLMTYRAGWEPAEGIIMFLREVEKEYGGENPLGDIGACIASHPDTDRRVYFAEMYLEELKEREEFEERALPARRKRAFSW